MQGLRAFLALEEAMPIPDPERRNREVKPKERPYQPDLRQGRKMGQVLGPQAGVPRRQAEGWEDLPNSASEFLPLRLGLGETALAGVCQAEP